MLATLFDRRMHVALVFLSVFLLLAGCAERQQVSALDPFVAQSLKHQTTGAVPPPGSAVASKVASSVASGASMDSYDLAFGIDFGLGLGLGLAAGGKPVDFDADTEATAQIYDPLEPWNRFWFGFNDVVYSFVWRPLGMGYNYALPQPIRKGVSNFFFNWKFPIRFVNCLLQGKLLSAGVEFSRFVGNTLFGGLGIYDITQDRKAVAEPGDEDFGQTLGLWGVGPGIYIVWPILGPSSARDTIGLGGDLFLDPISYINPWWLPYTNPTWWSITASGTRTLSNVAEKIDEIDALKESSIEQYSAFRDGYIQMRERKIKH